MNSRRLIFYISFSVAQATVPIVSCPRLGSNVVASVERWQCVRLTESISHLLDREKTLSSEEQ